MFRLIKYLLILSVMLFFAGSIMIDGFPQKVFTKVSGPKIYKVRSGERLPDIAARNKVDYLGLLAANKIGIADAWDDHTGKELVIRDDVSAQDKQIYLSYQEIYINDLKSELELRESALADQNSWIESEKNNINYIRKRGVSRAAQRNFNVRLENYNDKIKAYRKEYSDYTAAYERMNSVVGEYNQLAEGFNSESE